MKRLTYKTVGDAFRQPHYCHGPGVKKDDLLQRLGKLEDAFTEIPLVMIAISRAERNARRRRNNMKTMHDIFEIIISGMRKNT